MVDYSRKRRLLFVVPMFNCSYLSQCSEIDDKVMLGNRHLRFADSIIRRLKLNDPDLCTFNLYGNIRSVGNSSNKTANVKINAQS